MGAVLIFFSLVLLPSILLETNTKVDAGTSSLDQSKEYPYIVGLSVTPPKEPGIDDFNIRLLSSVLGSEKAAEKAYLWSYDVFGFAAKLTPEQAKRVGKLRDVESVDIYPLDEDLGTTNLAPQESAGL